MAQCLSSFCEVWHSVRRVITSSSSIQLHLHFPHNKSLVLWVAPPVPSDNTQLKLQATMSVFLLHSPPVYLSAMPLLSQLKAGNLQDAEEAVTHHTGNGSVHIEKALSKPGERQERNKPRSSNSPTVKTSTHISWADTLECCLILSAPFGEPKQLVTMDNCCTLGAGS